MRSRFVSLAAAGAVAVMSFLGLSAAARPAFPTEPALPRKSRMGGKPPKRRRSGETYPHSSTRQRARYARQIAAGQLSMAGVVKDCSR